MYTLLKQQLFDNSLLAYCFSVASILLGLLLKRLFSKLLAKAIYSGIKKHAAGVSPERLFELLRKPLELFIVLISIFFAVNHLQFPLSWELAPIEQFGVRSFLWKSYQLVVAISFIWIILRIVDFFGLVFSYRASLTASKADDQLIPFIREVVKIIIGTFGVFFILGTIFKLDITSLIAGLGIGGLAIALAAKESLENLLGSFTIFFDKPFTVGDNIKIGNTEGIVESIGFRSTRVRTAEQGYITIPNKKLVEAELENLSERTQHRIKFTIVLHYTTTLETTNFIIDEIKYYFLQHQLINNDAKVSLHELSATGITLQLLFFVSGNNPNNDIIVREDVNKKILEILNKHNTKLAFSNVLMANQYTV